MPEYSWLLSPRILYKKQNIYIKVSIRIMMDNVDCDCDEADLHKLGHVQEASFMRSSLFAWMAIWRLLFMINELGMLMDGRMRNGDDQLNG
jgi:hypothetical protein